MNPRSLTAFVRVAELGSLSRAATALDVAPSLVSRQIGQLEAAWGDRLFVRTGRGMALSAFGARMLAEVRPVLEQLDRLDTVAHEAAGALVGKVDLGVLPSMSRLLLPRLVADLGAAAPGVRLSVIEGFSGHLDEQLAAGRLDMIVVNRYGRSGARGEDVLGRIDTCLIGRPGSAPLAAATVPFAQLDGIPLVLPPVPNGLRATLDQLARRHAVTLPVVMEVDSTTAMKAVAEGGFAFTMLPAIAVREEIAAGTLAASRIVRPGIPRTIALGLSTHRPLSKAARFVAARLREAAMRALRA